MRKYNEIIVEAVKKAVGIEMEAIDKAIAEIIDPISEVGSPAKLIKKPAEQWTPEDINLLMQVYDKETLEQEIAKGAIKRMYELEQLERGEENA